MKIGFLGAGNMGGSILKGYALTAEQKKDQIFVYDKKEEVCHALEESLAAVTACASEKELVQKSDIILLGLKPNFLEPLLTQIAEYCTKDKLIISMAAGIRISLIEQYLGKDRQIIRIMPNTPAQVGEAMIAVCRNPNVGDSAFSKAMDIFHCMGRAEEIDEQLIDCVIGVSGSSPAYTYMYIQALMQAAEENGMLPEKARVFAAQAVLGAAKMVLENSDISVEQLRINVCSPGGTTIEAVNCLLENGFMEKVKDGFQAAVEKSKNMTK